MRSKKEGHGGVVWFTGLSGAGKSTLAAALAARLRARGTRVEVLDGDEVRLALGSELGFGRQDRATNVARLAYVAGLLSRHGVVTLVAAISPYRADRAAARQAVGDFVEVYLATPLEECRRRDVKGLYRRADAGVLKNFTGVSDPYEEPLAPELRLDTTHRDVGASVDVLVAELVARRWVDGETSAGAASGEGSAATAEGLRSAHAKGQMC